MCHTFSHAHCASLQLSQLKTFFLPCLTQTRLEQKVKASMATSLHGVFIEHSIIIRPSEHIYIYIESNWRLFIVRIHNRIQSCAEWTEQHGTSSCLHNHNGFNSPTDTEKEKWFAFILNRNCRQWCVRAIARALMRAPNTPSALANKAFKVIVSCLMCDG